MEKKTYVQEFDSHTTFFIHTDIILLLYHVCSQMLKGEIKEEIPDQLIADEDDNDEVVVKEVRNKLYIFK